MADFPRRGPLRWWPAAVAVMSAAGAWATAVDSAWWEWQALAAAACAVAATWATVRPSEWAIKTVVVWTVLAAGARWAFIWSQPRSFAARAYAGVVLVVLIWLVATLAAVTIANAAYYSKHRRSR